MKQWFSDIGQWLVQENSPQEKGIILLHKVSHPPTAPSLAFPENSWRRNPGGNQQCLGLRKLGGQACQNLPDRAAERRELQRVNTCRSAEDPPQKGSNITACAYEEPIQHRKRTN